MKAYKVNFLLWSMEKLNLSCFSTEVTNAKPDTSKRRSFLDAKPGFGLILLNFIAELSVFISSEGPYYCM